MKRVFVVLALSASACVIASEQPKTLPDWSGWWGFGTSPQTSYAMKPPPYRADRRAELTTREAGDLGRDLFCKPPAFAGVTGNFASNFEFLFTPGRVTITTEVGLIRRIYTDGRPLPANPRPTNSATSVGHWEGDTLVIETIGILPDARIGRIGPVGKNVHISERMRLVSPDVLETQIEIVAPDLFSEPDRRTWLSGRVRGKTEAVEFSTCNEHDRAYDPVTGKERFDATPPPDLPPPPGKAEAP